jgi:hypothetical protein
MSANFYQQLSLLKEVLQQILFLTIYKNERHALSYQLLATFCQQNKLKFARRIEANIKAIAQEMNQPCQVRGWMSDHTLDWKFDQTEEEYDSV